MVKKYRYLKIINKASGKARFLIHFKQMKFGFSQLLYNYKAIVIQKLWRGSRDRKSYHKLLTVNAQSLLLHIFTKAY
jgi:hypothetical protein